MEANLAFMCPLLVRFAFALLPQDALVIAQPPRAHYFFLDLCAVAGFSGAITGITRFSHASTLPRPASPKPTLLGLFLRVLSVVLRPYALPSAPAQALQFGFRRPHRHFRGGLARRLGGRDAGGLELRFRGRLGLRLGLPSPVASSLATSWRIRPNVRGSAAAVGRGISSLVEGNSSFGTSMRKRAVVAQPAGDARRLVAGAEIDVGPRRPDDRAAGILRENETAKPGRPASDLRSADRP